MRHVTSIVASATLAAALGACATDPYYARSNYSYGYAPGYAHYSPAYAYSSPRYYRTTTYDYRYPYSQYPQRNRYSSYWDYQRNYRGMHSAPELSSM